jgi:hypothetical protein
VAGAVLLERPLSIVNKRYARPTEKVPEIQVERAAIEARNWGFAKN